VKRFADFQAFSKAGRDLAHWHLNYETVAKGVKIEGSAEFQLRHDASQARLAHPANAASTPLVCLQEAPNPPLRRPAADSGPRSAEHYRVEKMKFAKTRDPETNKSINDKTTVFYNAHITLRDIPEAAYAYIVNGKPALEWVMERQSVSKDKDSGITNDANLWATETMNNPKYPLELFLRVIAVSLETMKIVEGLPKLDI
jgi:predicted helicase